MHLPATRRRRPRASSVVAACAAFLAAALAFAASAGAARGEDREGITVNGSGEVKGRPTQVQITATVSGDAELAADAIVKYRDARRRGMEALERLKMENLVIESDGFAVNQGVDANAQQMMMRGMATASVKQHVTVVERMRLLIKTPQNLEPEGLMDTVLKVIDTARDAGLTVGPAVPTNYYQWQYYNQTGEGGSMVSFRIPDPAALRDEAYKLAMDDARKKAKRLADLAGVRLAGITSVTDSVPVKDNNSQQMYMMYAYGGMPPRTDDSNLSSNVFGDIKVTVNLTVQFRIAEGEGTAAGDRGDAVGAAAGGEATEAADQPDQPAPPRGGANNRRGKARRPANADAESQPAASE